MQFALPPRKSSHNPPYARSPRISLLRRRQLRTLGLIALAFLTILYLLSHLFSSQSSFRSTSSSRRVSIPAGTPKVVLVTVFDRENQSKDYVKQIQRNREVYAAQHGYANFFANVSDYEYALKKATPRSWTTVPAVRHAMTVYPHSTYFFYLSPNALIMNPRLSLTSHVLDSKRIESLMLKDIPVVPPDSVIHTFSHLKADDVDLLLTQDAEDISSDSFIIRNGDWGQFFLDAWFDPLYRAYNFQKAEKHALDHLIQWHPTVLAKLALLPQRLFNSYSRESPSSTANSTYQDGDFVLHFMSCNVDPMRNCEQEIQPYYTRWKKTFDTTD